MRLWIPLAVIVPLLAGVFVCGCGSASSSSSSGSGAQTGAVRFSTLSSHVTLGNPYAVIADDFNRDGKADLLSAGGSGSIVAYHRNTTTTGVGTASFASYTAIGVGTGPRACASTDLNGDGLADVAVCNTAANSVTTLENTSTPADSSVTFSATTFALTGSPQGVAFADVNADGKPDMAVTRTDVDTLTVFINNTTPGSTPSFLGSPTDAGTGDKPVGVVAGDLNGDGRPDFVTANMADAFAGPPTIGNITVLINQTAAGAAAASFSLGVTYNAGYTAIDVALGDVNLDGKLDIVASNYDSNTISVFINATPAGDASPAFAAPLNFATRALPWGLVCRDFSGDGKVDIAVANAGASSFSVFVNDTVPGAAAPAFSQRVNIAAGTGSDDLFSADYNGDGKPDIAVANNTTSSLSVHLNTTALGSTAVTFATASNLTHTVPRAVAIRDINGNGNPDLAVAAASTADDVDFRLNETAAGATSPVFGSVANLSVGDDPNALVYTDLDADGMPDIATVDPLDDTVSLLLNTTGFPNGGTPPPTFTAGGTLTTADAPQDLVVADFNGDGLADLAVACAGTDNVVSILLRDVSAWPGAVTFLAKQDVSVGNVPESLVAADFNLDGRVDLAVANRTAETITVLRNDTSIASTTATFTLADTVTLLAGSSPASIGAADVNGDGYPDLVTANAGTSNVTVLVNKTPPVALPVVTPIAISFDNATSADNFATGLTPLAVTVADMNLDGLPDVVAANSGDGTVSVLLNVTTPGQTAASCSAKVDFATGTGTRAVATGDVNRDGLPDVAAANEGAGTVSILLGE